MMLLLQKFPHPPRSHRWIACGCLLNNELRNEEQKLMASRVPPFGGNLLMGSHAKIATWPSSKANRGKPELMPPDIERCSNTPLAQHHKLLTFQLLSVSGRELGSANRWLYGILECVLEVE
jgi:hypothetical protein